MSMKTLFATILAALAAIYAAAADLTVSLRGVESIRNDEAAARIVLTAPAEIASLRAFCGLVDGGQNEDGWTFVTEPTAGLDSGEHLILLEGLDPATIYWVSATASNATDGVVWAPHAVQFVTKAAPATPPVPSTRSVMVDDAGVLAYPADFFTANSSAVMDLVAGLPVTNYTETDPIWGGVSAAVLQVATDFAAVSNDAALGATAHSWGDHAAAGYITNIPALAETDPIWAAESNDVLAVVNDWPAVSNAAITAHGWGDHGAAGYLTGYTETDPIWSGISNSIISGVATIAGISNIAAQAATDAASWINNPLYKNDGGALTNVAGGSGGGGEFWYEYPAAGNVQLNGYALDGVGGISLQLPAVEKLADGIFYDAHGAALLDGGQTFYWGGATNIPAAARCGVSKIVCAASLPVVLAIKDGELLAWGDSPNSDAWGLIEAVNDAALTGVDDVAIYDSWYYGHAVVLQDGVVSAVGPYAVPAEPSSGVSSLASGSQCAFAIKDGAVYGWGDSLLTNIPAEASSGISALSVSPRSAIAVKDGGVITWGERWSWADEATIPAAATSDVVAVYAGMNFGVAMKVNGDLISIPDGAFDPFEYGMYSDPGEPLTGIAGNALYNSDGDYFAVIKGGRLIGYPNSDWIPEALRYPADTITGGDWLRGYGDRPDTAYRGDWGEAVSNIAATALQPSGAVLSLNGAKGNLQLTGRTNMSVGVSGTNIYLDTVGVGDFKSDGTKAMSGNLNLGGKQLTNAAGVVVQSTDLLELGRANQRSAGTAVTNAEVARQIAMDALQVANSADALAYAASTNAEAARVIATNAQATASANAIALTNQPAFQPYTAAITDSGTITLTPAHGALIKLMLNGNGTLTFDLGAYPTSGVSRVTVDVLPGGYTLGLNTNTIAPNGFTPVFPNGKWTPIYFRRGGSGLFEWRQ